MRADQLKSPGVLANGQTLRHQSAHAISRAELNLAMGGIDTSNKLQEFFQDCIDKLTAAEAAYTPTAAQTTSSVDDATAALNQEVTFTVLVKNAAGTALAGVPILFSFDPTSTAAGRVFTTPVSVVSGAGGVASVKCKATGAGNMVLDADISFNGATVNETATVVVA